MRSTYMRREPAHEPAKTGGQQATQFKPGQSGNPNGRPAGSRHRTTLAVDALLDGDAERLTRKAIEMALGGDGTAMRLCLDRIAPARKDRPVPFTLPTLETAADAKAAAAAIVRAVADGDLTPNEAAELSKVLENFIRILETTDFETRLEALERKGTP
jgi:Family of unknown function (DUF5681)